MQRNSGSKFFTQQPVEALRPFVKRILVVEFPAPREDSHLPDTGFVAAFRFRGECRLDNGNHAPRAGATGLYDRLRYHAHGKDNAVALALFTPTGAAAFLRHPLDELANTTVELSSLFGNEASLVRLDEQLAEAPDNIRRTQLVENFLLARIGRTGSDPLVAAAVAWIEHAPPGARIEHVVRYIGLSQSALERRFRRLVGVSPKKFAALVRMKAIVQLHATGSDFTSIAHAAGYFDQSHFNHDFKRVTGLAPESYFAHAALS